MFRIYIRKQLKPSDLHRRVDLYHGICKLRAPSPTVLFWDLTNPVRGHGPARVMISVSFFAPFDSPARPSVKLVSFLKNISCARHTMPFYARVCVCTYIYIYNLGHFIVHLRSQTLALPSSIRIRQSRVLFAIY